MEKPAFEIFEIDAAGKRVNWLHIYASGKVKCSQGVLANFCIINRIPQLISQAESAGFELAQSQR